MVSTFVYGARANVPNYIVKGGVSYRIIADQLGSVRLVVNSASGQVMQRMDYDEFGRVLTDTNPGFQPFGFAGGLYDRDTGLVHFGAREYDPALGRWTTKDPLLFAGGQTNVYVYAQNDPVNFTDANGLDWVGTFSQKLNEGKHYVQDHAKELIDKAVHKLAKDPCYGPACLSTDKPEVTVGTRADLEVGGKTVVSVEAECGVGINTKGTAKDPLFNARIKLGAKVPALTKIPGMGKYFQSSTESTVEFGQARDFASDEMNIDARNTAVSAH